VSTLITRLFRVAVVAGLFVEVAELPVTVGMLLAFQRFCVALQTEAIFP
jgi:hypothetical protein